MKRLALGFVMMVLLGCSPADDRLAQGSEADWSKWNGRWVLVNYWAEWCTPCRKEIPELNRLHEAGGDDGVVVLGVNFDGLQDGALVEVMDRMGIDFRVLESDPRARWDVPLPSVLPSTLVIGPDGELSDVLVGPQTFEDLSRAVQLTESM